MRCRSLHASCILNILFGVLGRVAAVPALDHHTVIPYSRHNHHYHLADLEPMLNSLSPR